MLNQMADQDDEPVLPTVTGLIDVRDFVFRYFKVSKLQGPVFNQYIHQHSNGLCVVGICNSDITNKPGKISFDKLTKDTDNLVSGKKKRGGVKVRQNTVIAELTIEKESFDITAGVEGTVLQLNNRLIAQPCLLKDSQGQGWIAIIRPEKARKH